VLHCCQHHRGTRNKQFMPLVEGSIGVSDAFIQQAQWAALLVCAYQSSLSELAAQPSLPFTSQRGDVDRP